MLGEGEYALLELTKQFEKKGKNFERIPNIAYREKGNIKVADKNNVIYADLSSKDLIPEYTDYLRDKELYLIYDYALSLELSRGCHWNKCHFCYLNTGYKYRRKSLEKIKQEIIFLIEKYECFRFSTTDNDLVGADIDNFDRLLDTFIEIRRIYPQFIIVVAEVVTKGLNRKLIKKMADAGLMKIQIGYESSSNNLLTKIQKINSFATNTLFLKFSYQYKINITGLNIIYNLFEETDEDIMEAISNLRFLRFFRAYFGLNHHLTPLTINSTSKYYKKYNILIDKNVWQPVNTTTYHLDNYWKEDSGWHVLDYAKYRQNFLWQYFEIIDGYYLQHRYRYSLKESEDSFIFNEFCDDSRVVSIKIDKGAIEYSILKACNDEVVSFADLLLILSVEEGMLREKLDDFFYKGLIYHNSDFSEIISVINVD